VSSRKKTDCLFRNARAHKQKGQPKELFGVMGRAQGPGKMEQELPLARAPSPTGSLKEAGETLRGTADKRKPVHGPGKEQKKNGKRKKEKKKRKPVPFPLGKDPREGH